MDELLQKLLEAEVLSEETKVELEEAFQQKVNEAIEEAKKSASDEVRAELTEQWVAERDALIEAVDSKVSDFLQEEVEELKGDIERFRDLEAEYAEKLVEAKGEMSEELQKDLAELVEKIDAFLEIRLNAEIEELREDIDEVRKNEFGRKIFEAYVAEFSDNFADTDDNTATLRETQEQLNDALESLEETEKKIAEMERKEKMRKVLSPLSGQSRDVMEAILKNVSTDQLDEAYKTFIGRVLREAEQAEASEEKEDSVLAEGASEKVESGEVEVVTGDDEAVIAEEAKEEETSKSTLTESELSALKKLAGISN